MLSDETAEAMLRLRVRLLGAMNAAMAWSVAVKTVPPTI
jgi:hypothetical protein